VRLALGQPHRERVLSLHIEKERQGERVKQQRERGTQLREKFKEHGEKVKEQGRGGHRRAAAGGGVVLG